MGFAEKIEKIDASASKRFHMLFHDFAAAHPKDFAKYLNENFNKLNWMATEASVAFQQVNLSFQAFPYHFPLLRSPPISNGPFSCRYPSTIFLFSFLFFSFLFFFFFQLQLKDQRGEESEQTQRRCIFLVEFTVLLLRTLENIVIGTPELFSDKEDVNLSRLAELVYLTLSRFTIGRDSELFNYVQQLPLRSTNALSIDWKKKRKKERNEMKCQMPNAKCLVFNPNPIPHHRTGKN